MTLETITAVRMARFEKMRGANLGLRPMQAKPAHDLTTARTAKSD